MSDEVRTTSSTGGQKGVKEERYDLIPVEALRWLAILYGRGARKYDDHNWRKGYEWSKSYASVHRHMNAFWGGEDMDACKPECPEECLEHTNVPHVINAAWHALGLSEFMETHPDFDDRWKREYETRPLPQARCDSYYVGVSGANPVQCRFASGLPHAMHQDEGYKFQWVSKTSFFPQCSIKCPRGEHAAADRDSQCKYFEDGHTKHVSRDDRCDWRTK